MADDTSFLGRGWGFPPEFDPQNGVRMVEAEDDIRESLRILLSTQVGERLLAPRYGCDLMKFVFEPLTATMATYIKELVRTAVLYFEPRVIVERINLSVDSIAGRLDIELEYVIPATNTRYNLVYPFYLEEGVVQP